MSQRMIRVSESAYWELKARAVLAQASVASVVDELLRETLVRMEPLPPPAVPLVIDVDEARFAAVRARAVTGPFSKAAQLGKKP